ncbi:hypothetical protein DJ93_236 [Bacillus clarus]|uniref:Uncharacterized protein n=1 Tax=Bacillus clarus TaxID=2338372 RepID=A0A090ZHM5_9BACI|nr:hypothetical protein DJ93_236 [Bacillus clarus]
MLLLQKECICMYLHLVFQLNQLMIRFIFMIHCKGVPVRIHARKGLTHLYSVKKFRDIIQGNAHAQALIKENSKNIMLIR